MTEKDVASARKPFRESVWVDVLVWIARVAVGIVFIASGFAKAVDPWGVLYKMEEYLWVLGLSFPRSIVLTGSVALALWEGVLGAMLLLGCYRRGSVIALLATMAFMLPLSAWIFFADPVADCGCFGEMLVISNGVTFVKNIVIVALLIFLLIYNRRVVGLISPWIQWLGGASVVVYLLLVALIGYNMQPLIDFRNYPEGTLLAEDPEEDDSGAVNFEFIYSKDGEERSFTIDNLPDSSWTFVDRKMIQGETVAPDDFVVYEHGRDVTADVIADEGQQVIVLIPDLKRVDISFTSYINSLNRYLTEHGGSMIGVIATDEQGLGIWRDASLAEYPLYTAEPNSIKELARGNVALVYLRDGRVVWKRTASSIDGEELLSSLENGSDPLPQWRYNSSGSLSALTWGLAVILIFIIFADGIRRFFMGGWRRPKKDIQN